MKKIYAVLGLALLMGCANSNDDCPRKKKDCGNSLTKVEAPAVEQKTVAQEDASVATPSK